MAAEISCYSDITGIVELTELLLLHCEAVPNFPRLSVCQIEICLIIPHMEGPVSTMCVIMLIRWVPVFTLCPLCTQVFQTL